MPGLCGKLKDAWEGPYEVYRRLGEVNYKVIAPKVVHVNNCKLWHPVDVSVLRIVVAAEEEDELEKDIHVTKLAGDILTTFQR